jgi:hypothetical protein
MGSNFDKTILILNGDKTKSGLAIKALAMDLDTKFDELDKKNDARHEAILNPELPEFIEYNNFVEGVKQKIKLEC